ncbi:MAG: hypothetical protein QXY79_01185, partial [Candidatus Methanomethylicia archaeon]
MKNNNLTKNFLAINVLSYKPKMRFGKKYAIEVPKRIGIKTFFIKPTRLGIYYLDWIIGALKSIRKLIKISKKYYCIISFVPYFLPLLFLTKKPIIFISFDYFEGETYRQKIKKMVYKLIKHFFIPKCIAVIGTTNYIKKSFEGIVSKNKLFMIRTGIDVKD